MAVTIRSEVPLNGISIAPARGDRGLPLPPGSLPLPAVHEVLRRYAAGVATDADLLAAVDRHSAALETEIARAMTGTVLEFTRTVARLAALSDRLARLQGQAAWLHRWPAGGDQPPIHAVIVAGRRYPVPLLLDVLRGTLEVDERTLVLDTQPATRARGKRGESASMAALHDAGVTSTDVALALGVKGNRAWAILAGRQPPIPGLREALEQLVGADVAEIVLAGIPQLPRARAQRSQATAALHAAGAVADDVARLMPVQPGHVRRMLAGRARAHPKLQPALEQLLGAETPATSFR